MPYTLLVIAIEACPRSLDTTAMSAWEAITTLLVIKPPVICAHITPIARPVSNYEKAQIRRATIKMTTISASPLLTCSATSINSTPTAPVLIADGQILRGGSCGDRCHFARVGLWLQLDSRPARHARLGTARLITHALVWSLPAYCSWRRSAASTAERPDGAGNDEQGGE